MAVDVHWTRGYTRGELDAAQERFDLRFPPDLLDLLLDRRPVEGYDWRFDDDEIKRALAWSAEGIIFDVEENDFWLDAWGQKPSSAQGRATVVSDAVKMAPKLVPILSHRYIPAEPALRGNPIFSIYQTDIIHYGANLAEYFSNEFEGTWVISSPRRIRFWSDLVDLNS